WPTALTLNSSDGSMYLGNLGVHRSPDGGQTWTDLGAPHVDETSLAWDAGGRLLLGGDGGIFRSGGSPGSWAHLNATLPIPEIYGVAAHPTDAGRALVGTQDNGTVELSSGAWTRTFGGDGGEVLYDASGTIVYLETQWDSSGAYNFERCQPLGGSCQRRVSGI